MTEPNDPKSKDDSTPSNEPAKAAKDEAEKPAPQTPDVSSSEAAKPEAGGKKSKKSAAKKPKVKEPGRWRKRIVRAFMLVIVIGLAFQILLWALLPWTLRRAAKFYGLDLTCDRPDLSLFNSDAGLWHVKVTQNGQSVASVDYCRADISILNLLRGKLIIQRLEADGVDLTVQRDADGSIPLLKSILFAGPKPGSAPPPKSPNGKPTPIELRSPVTIDALVLTHVRTHLIDHAVKPDLNTEVQMNLRLTDIGSTERPPKFSLQLVPSPLSIPLLDSVAIEAGCKTVNDGQSVDAYFSASARGLHPKLLEGYLAPLGITVTADGVAMAARGTVDIHVLPANPNAVAGKIDLTQLLLTADGKDAAAMDAVTIDVDSAAPNSLSVGKIALTNGSFLAERTTDGAFRVAGFEFKPGGKSDSSGAQTTSKPPAEKSSPVAPAVLAATSTAAATPFIFNLGEFSLKNFRASFKDADVKPAADIEFVIDSLSLRNATNDPAKPGSAIAIAGSFSAPEILRDVKIDGTCQAFSTKKTFALNVDAGGIHPDALGPYFAMMGVDSDLKSARFTCQLTADVSQPTDDSLAINARLAHIKFADDTELLALDDVKLSGIGLSPGRVRIDAIDVTGPRAAARREKSGAIWAAGFRLKKAATPPTVADDAAASSSPVHGAAGQFSTPTSKPVVDANTLASLPKIDIGRFTWTGVQFHLDDQDAPEGAPPTAVSVDDAGVELTGLHIDFDPNAPVAAHPAHLRAFLKAPGLAGDVQVDGTIAQRSGGLVADLEITGKQLSAILAGPYLKAMNIEPTLRDGTIHTRAHVDVAQLDDGIAASVSASEFQLNDPTGELLGADEAALSAIHLTANTLEVGAVSLKKPRGQFAREEGGAISAVGFRLLPVQPKPKASAFTAEKTPAAGVSSTAAPQVSTARPAGEVPATQRAEGLQIFVLKKFSIEDGAFGWTDRMVKPTAQITAHVDGDVAGVTWGKPADPATLRFTLKADGIVDEAKIAGTLTATADSAGTKLDISAVGIRQGGLAPYLPPGMTIELKDGRFKTHADAAFALNPKGGAGGMLLISALDYRDGTEPTPLFSLDSVKVVVPRVDIPAGVVDVDEVSVSGAEGRARLAKDGTMHAMGIAIAPATQPAATQPAAVAQAPATQPATVIATAPVAPLAPGVESTAVASDRLPSLAPLVVVKKKYPLITLKKLDLNLKRFTLTDESRDNVPPIAVSDLHLIANKPIELLGKDAAAGPATDLGLSLKIDNVIDSLKVNLQVAPFAGEPTAVVDITGAGIHGDGLLAQAPDLKSQIDAAQLTDGKLHAHVFAKMKLDRFDPLEFPLDRAFDVDATVKNVEFRATEKGPVLIGVEEIRSEGIHVHPADKSIVAKTLEMENIVGQAMREKDGIHALGVVLKMPAEPTTQPATQPAGTAVAKSTATPSSASAKSPPAKSAVAITGKSATAVATTAPAPAAPAEDDKTGEIRITKVFVTGLDFRMTDNTVSPPLLVPLNQLDLEVRNLSSKAFTAERPPTHFSLLVGAGKVPLPRKSDQPIAAATPPAPALPSLAGLADAKKPLAPKAESISNIEDRDLFSQIQADGELTFYPQPKGWLKASVSAFDLAEISSTAKTMKIDLANGVFDAAIDERLPGDGSLITDSHFIFTDMDLSEPENGPIRKTLRLPSPLNFVLLAIVRADGSVDVPLKFVMEKGKLTTGEITDAAINAFGVIVGNAIAAVPQKSANAVLGAADKIIPFSAIFGQPKPKNNGPFNIVFSAGDDGLSAADQAQLDIALERMKEDPDLELTMHSDLSGGPMARTLNLDLMTGDIGRARLRANPSQEECRELINRLSRRKDDLIRRRLDVLGQARGDVASRSTAESAATLERLRAVERELSATEDALDRLYEMERPGAARQAGRRTKQAALAVARSRERAIIGYLMSSGMSGVETRTNITHPQFAPLQSDDTTGGSVVITVTVKRKS